MSDDYRQRVTDRVRELRTQGHLSQEQLAAVWGRSRHTVLRLEQGKIAPDLGLLAELAGVFKITLVEFLGPVLLPEKALELEAEAVHAAEVEAVQRTRRLAEEQTERLGRPDLHSLVKAVADIAADMEDADLAFLLKDWTLRREYLRLWKLAKLDPSREESDGETR